jgi:hypothetical protein
MTINVRIVTTDSGTGEETIYDAAVPALTGQAVVDAYMAGMAVDAECSVDEVELHTLRAWVPQGDNFGIIMTCDDVMFGKVLVVGIVYTNYV